MKDIIKQEADSLLLRPKIKEIKKATEMAKANATQSKRLQLLGTSTMYTSETLSVGEAVNGMVLSSIFHPDLNSGNFDKNVKNLWNATVNWRTATSYDAMWVIISALQNTSPAPNSKDLQKIIAANNIDIEGATGNIKFNKEGEREDEHLIRLIEIKPNTNPINTNPIPAELYKFTLIPLVVQKTF